MGCRIPEDLRKLLKYEDEYDNEKKFNYNKSKIFVLKSDNSDRIYIGNTINSLSNRLYNMEQEFLYWQDHGEYYREYFEILKKKDYKIELIEDYSCDNIYQLDRRTIEHIRKDRAKCVNINLGKRLKSEIMEDVLSGVEEEYLEKSRDFLRKNDILEIEKTIRNMKNKNVGVTREAR